MLGAAGAALLAGMLGAAGAALLSGMRGAAGAALLSGMPGAAVAALLAGMLGCCRRCLGFGNGGGSSPSMADLKPSSHDLRWSVGMPLSSQTEAGL